ncbi:hypothetical protein [Muricoccus aerilatus]|uniref:hypothetical protein n=1 Tax=Muricoccus aerilatus TaxID=452982 RepID=UPI0012EBEE77|nr:hypothetical protein [Roseomonas aerilata]
MGEAKRKQRSRKLILEEDPWCCYCGAPATTTDHCPPRAIFDNRIWPEGHEFPCCAPCNEAGRRSEQVAAAILSVSLVSDAPDEPWQRTVKSLKVNRPDIWDEWQEGSRNDQRRLFREKFGLKLGDLLRQQQYGIIQLGPHSTKALEDVLGRLGQALFYKHAGRRCTGRVWVLRVDMLNIEGALDKIQRSVPLLAASTRSNVDLSDQFQYRYNVSPSDGIFAAVVKIREQFGAMIVVMDEPHATAFADMPAGQRMKVRECPP